MFLPQVHLLFPFQTIIMYIKAPSFKYACTYQKISRLPSYLKNNLYLVHTEELRQSWGL